MGGDCELRREAAPGRAVPSSRECSAGRDRLVGLRDRRHGCAVAAGGRSCVGREILLCRCCDRPCLGAPGSLAEVNDAVLVAGGTLPVALLRGLPADPGCG
jgi:hypothetical protein